MADLDDLTGALAAAPSLEDALRHLLGDLAARVKATSNDTNIQRLARDLTAATPDIVRAVAAKQTA